MDEIFKENTKQFERVNSSHKEKLLSLFNEISQDQFFKPHPLTPEYIDKICLAKEDVYVLWVIEGEIAAYGMLRGMDAGWDIPSLGIYIAKKFRGKGLAKPFMLELHKLAYQYTAIRLTVNKQNTKAIKLYESLGYQLSDLDENNLVGYLK